MISLIGGIFKKKKKDTNELLYKTETDSDLENSQLPGVKGAKEG